MSSERYRRWVVTCPTVTRGQNRVTEMWLTPLIALLNVIKSSCNNQDHNQEFISVGGVFSPLFFASFHFFSFFPFIPAFPSLSVPFPFTSRGLKSIVNAFLMDLQSSERVWWLQFLCCFWWTKSATKTNAFVSEFSVTFLNFIFEFWNTYCCGLGAIVTNQCWVSYI